MKTYIATFYNHRSDDMGSTEVKATNEELAEAISWNLAPEYAISVTVEEKDDDSL